MAAPGTSPIDARANCSGATRNPIHFYLPHQPKEGVNMSSTLDEFLKAASAKHESLRPVAETILHMSKAAVTVQAAIASGRVPAEAVPVQDQTNPSGEMQKALDLFADRVFLQAAKDSPVAYYGSEEQELPVVIADAGLALAIDPLDGSSNIETNISVGTIFSLLPVGPEHRADPASAYRQPGTSQLAAGFFIYGPQLLLVTTLGEGTQVFIHVPDEGRFVTLNAAPSVPSEAAEYAINASNRRHWQSGVRAYVEDLEEGKNGPRGRNFGMRYVGSLVAEAYRIFQRGGVFLYPADRRSGYAGGRLRQLYETNPIAFCIEQAGGAATNGTSRMLELVPDSLHMKAPFVFGSSAEVEVIASYLAKADAS
jgi:fructose-1,6-bisphosphatase I